MNAEAKKEKKVKVSSAPKKKRKIVSLDKKKARVGYLFVLPFIIGLLIVYLPMIYQSINYSFHELDPVQGGGYKLVPVGHIKVNISVRRFFTYLAAVFTKAKFLAPAGYPYRKLSAVYHRVFYLKGKRVIGAADKPDAV